MPYTNKEKKRQNVVDGMQRHRLRKRTQGVCIYGGCWNSVWRPSSCYCQSHIPKNIKCDACGIIISPLHIEESLFRARVKWCIWREEFNKYGIPEDMIRSSYLEVCQTCLKTSKKRVLHMSNMRE